MQLTFGSGIRVKLYRNQYGMNIYLDVPYTNETHSGLCGNYNGDIDDDLPKTSHNVHAFGEGNRYVDKSVVCLTN